jgi:alkylhydroperoxidase/carboxymuconolactone decarboxylase family protein YurZ
MMTEMPSIDRAIELERADAVRKALEEAAQRVEAQAGGETYRKAFKAAAQILRDLKAKW